MKNWAIKLNAILSKLGTILSIVFILISNAAFAQSVNLLGDHKDWSAYTTSQGDNKLCFTISKPKNVSPKPNDYKQSYLYITHKPNENIKNEINFVAGFEFAPNSNASINVGGQLYPLFVKGDAAWLDDVSKANNLVGQMRAGSILTISGLTVTGVKITQTFSLSGVTAASRAIDRACP